MGIIYLKQADGSLVAMEKQRYETEALLQDLIARNPQILAGEFNEDQWLLVKREMPVPSDENTLWLDHLFLDQVAINLRANKMRLLFVSDLISSELRRIVEFLNEQMETVEVLAIEIRQFVSQQGQSLLVPNLVGETITAQTRKGKLTEYQW